MNNYYNYLPCPRETHNQTTGTQMMPVPAQISPQMQTQNGGAIPMFPLPQIGTTLPTGMPLGPAPTGTPSVPGLAIPAGEQPPQTLQSTQYTPGYLRTQIGRRVRVEFLIGTNGTTDRLGTLVGVGASYILIRPEDTDDIMLCDIYSIKFVTFYY
ncbi:MAG: hypothetical protein N3I35_06215 [Clostridia bacterium]|nr:hypothetical protein [Clostridia bacterium]